MKYDEMIKDLRICASTFTEPCEECSHTEAGDCYNKLKRNAADAIEELQKPKWISVTERLPEEKENVLCRCWENRVRILYFNGEVWVVVGAYIKSFVTHWMPLPEPPKEETDG